jgi:hypothetical protein
MPETRLVVVDPGHFHATLVQQQMYPELSPVVRVYAPLGPDLIDYLSRIARYNRRPQAATDWRLDVHAGPDFLDRIRDEPPGGVAIFSGRNRGKIDRIIAALEAGLHVLADKPAIIEPADLPRLEAALTMANEQQLVLTDMMTGRHNTLVRLLQALRCDPEVFGDPVPGTSDEPGVVLSGVHYLRKVVAGLPNPRPAWYFDVTEQGEGLADTGVHLADRGHEMLFPEQPLDWQRDIEILAASRWPTPVSLSQFRELSGEGKWPDDLAPWIRGDVLEYLCNGRVDYRVRGIHVRLEVPGIGRPSRATIRITLFTAVPVAGLACGRVSQSVFSRSYTSCRMRISVRRCSGALLSCSRATPGLPWRLLDRNGGSRYPRRYGSAMTPLSRPLPAAFSRVPPIRRRCRRARDPIYSQNTG